MKTKRLSNKPLMKSLGATAGALLMFQPFAHAILIGTVDPDNNTISFSGTSTRVDTGFPPVDWTVGGGTFGHQDIIPNTTALNTGASGGGELRIWFDLSTLNILYVRFIDPDIVGSTDPVVADPSVLVPYNPPDGGAAFEAALALGDIELDNGGQILLGSTEPLIFRLKESSTSVPDAGGTSVLLALVGLTLWAGRRFRVAE